MQATRSRDWYQSLVEGLIEQGIEQGAFRPVPTRVATLALFGMTNWSYQWYRPGGKSSYREVADDLLNISVEGVQRTLA